VAANRRQLAVLPGPRVAGVGQPARADLDQLEALGQGRRVEDVAEQPLVGNRHRRLELRRQQREGLQRRRSVRPLVGVEGADVREDSGDLGQAEPEQVEEHVAAARSWHRSRTIMSP
jgi:hypothetical protein